MPFTLIREVTPGQLNNNEIGRFVTGPLGDLETKGNFDYNIYQYPLIQNPDYPDKGHNVVFYINIPDHSYWNNTDKVGPDPVANRETDATRFGLRSNTPQSGVVGQVVQDAVGQVANWVLNRRSKRTTAAVSLYIPPTMAFSQTASYKEVSFSRATGVVGNISAAIGTLSQGDGGTGLAGALASVLPNIALTSGAGRAITNAGRIAGLDLQAARDSALAALGIADNPQNFLLFKQMEFRKFQFDFLLTPENEQEAMIIREIIRLLRFHSVPEVYSGSIGRFFVPPSDFDIDFVFDGGRNINIPRISTCILENIMVDYSYSNQWVTTMDGMPSQIRLTLDFKETEILTKDRVEAGW